MQGGDRRPFVGVKVLDVTRVLAGPFASYQLGLMGAEVVKIERPVHGDTVRWRSGADVLLGRAGFATSYLTQGANKRCITLNLDTEEGRDIFLELARTADVVIHNLRTGSMDRRGVGYDAVRTVNPRIVYCSITGYGNTGPKARHPAYDHVIQAASGIMASTGTPETAPLRTGAPIVDYGTGLAAAFAIASALYQRDRTGEGQYIDVSMLDTNLALMASMVTEFFTAGYVPEPRGNEAASRSPTSGVYRTREGLLALAVSEEHQYENLWRVLGRPDVLDDPRFADPAERRRNQEALRELIEQTVAQRGAADWEEPLNEAGVPAARVRDLPQALAEPQVASRGFLHRFENMEGIGRDVVVPLAPFRYAHDGPAVDFPPRAIGADTDAILEAIGYDEPARAGLRGRGVID